ncbi:hypothetical protein [Acinetobacter sp. ANC 5054]|nr:hypothetical protein [Acinetobacter sp. ANC 5054]
MNESLLWLRIGISFAIIVLLSLALLLWFNTPELFEYFNQAFCAH